MELPTAIQQHEHSTLVVKVCSVPPTSSHAAATNWDVTFPLPIKWKQGTSSSTSAPSLHNVHSNSTPAHGGNIARQPQHRIYSRHGALYATAIRHVTFILQWYTTPQPNMHQHLQHIHQKDVCCMLITRVATLQYSMHRPFPSLHQHSPILSHNTIQLRHISDTHGVYCFPMYTCHKHSQYSNLPTDTCTSALCGLAPLTPLELLQLSSADQNQQPAKQPAALLANSCSDMRQLITSFEHCALHCLT